MVCFGTGLKDSEKFLETRGCNELTAAEEVRNFGPSVRDPCRLGASARSPARAHHRRGDPPLA
eukprot:6170037-Alexandrium_andersonii.AAC.1